MVFWNSELLKPPKFDRATNCAENLGCAQVGNFVEELFRLFRFYSATCRLDVKMLHNRRDPYFAFC